MRQERVDVLGLGDRQPGQHIAQIGVGIEAVGLGAFDQAEERRRGVATALARHKQPGAVALVVMRMVPQRPFFMGRPGWVRSSA